MPTIAADKLVPFATACFRARGVPPSDAEVVARSLVDANLAGHDSHGLIRLVQYVKALEQGHLQAGVPLKIVSQTPAVLVCDGGWGLGQVQAHRLLERLTPIARTLGIAAGTLRQCGHIGRLGEYAEAAAAQGLVLFSSVNNHGFGRSVAPPGGKMGRISTNPLCIGMPAQEPIVLDIGTSVCAEGKVRVAFNKGEQVPPNWLLDPEGQPTTDPGVLYREPRGTILPLGGAQAYKGFGIGLLLDMLVGGLSGSPCSRPEIGPRTANAVLFVLFDPALFAGADHCAEEVNTLARTVRACPPTDPAKPVQLPGDPERQTRAKRVRDGIPIDEGTWTQLVELAERLGVALVAGEARVS